MPLLEGKCNNCGGIIKFDSNSKTGSCPYCNTPYLAEDIINNYNTYNSYNISHANIQMVNENTVEKKLNNAELYLTKIKNFEKARQCFEEVTEEAPDNYLGWWGLVRTYTMSFTATKLGTEMMSLLEYYANNALVVAPENKKSSLQDTWQKYHDNSLQYSNDLIKQKEELDAQMQNICKEQESLSKTIESKNKVYNFFSTCKSVSGFILFSIIAAIVCFIFHFSTVGVLLIVVPIAISIFGAIGSSIAFKQLRVLNKTSIDYDKQIRGLNKQIEAFNNKITYGE